jgi:hypothetical protein
MFSLSAKAVAGVVKLSPKSRRAPEPRSGTVVLASGAARPVAAPSRRWTWAGPSASALDALPALVTVTVACRLAEGPKAPLEIRPASTRRSGTSCISRISSPPITPGMRAGTERDSAPACACARRPITVSGA